jgi:hypothetical protein
MRRHKLGKSELAETFAELVAEGAVTGVPCDRRLSGSAGPASISYWEALVEDLLHKRIDIDPEFLGRSSQFV